VSTERDERTKQLWHQCYLAGERFIEAYATWERLCGTDPDDTQAYQGYVAAEGAAAQASSILRELLTHTGLPEDCWRLVLGAAGLMELTWAEDVAQAVWREEPIDVRPTRPERLWDGRERRSANPSRLPLYNQYAVPAETVEVEHVG
jgi:hypothetical protein